MGLLTLPSSETPYVLETKNGKQGSPVSCQYVAQIQDTTINSCYPMVGIFQVGLSVRVRLRSFHCRVYQSFHCTDHTVFASSFFCVGREGTSVKVGFPSGSGNQSDCHMINLLLSTVFTPVS